MASSSISNLRAAVLEYVNRDVTLKGEHKVTQVKLAKKYGLKRVTLTDAIRRHKNGIEQKPVGRPSALSNDNKKELIKSVQQEALTLDQLGKKMAQYGSYKATDNTPSITQVYKFVKELKAEGSVIKK